MKTLMKRALSLWSVAILTFCGILALAGERATAPVIENVRLGVHESGHTRIVLDMDADPAFSAYARSKPTTSLAIVVEQGTFKLDGQPLPRGTGLIDGLRVGRGHLVVDLKKPSLPARSFVLEPTEKNDRYRLVIDVEAVPQGEFDEAVSEADARIISANEQQAIILAEFAPELVDLAKIEAEAAKVAAAPKDIPDVVRAAAADGTETGANAPKITRVPSLKPVRAVAAATPPKKPAATDDPVGNRLVIVIDPGHGGHDPGSIGSTGLEEKRVTWSAAQALGKELTARGYAVIYTRQGDEFLSLAERIEFARVRQADMFLSIHADANPVPSVRGASVYTLSEDRSEQFAQEVTELGDFRVFDRELSSEDRDVSSILFDLANTDTKNQSDRLASALIREMKGRVMMVNNTHRRAGLAVLLSPDVPAVLVELAFMSNDKDEANLGSRTWRNNTAAAIADGIDDYFAAGRRAGRYADTYGGN